MTTLTGIWALVEWQDNGAFERLSDNGNPGDWEPWILYVALVWGFFLVLDVLKVYFDRPTTEAEIERAVDGSGRPARRRSQVGSGERPRPRALLHVRRLPLAEGEDRREGVWIRRLVVEPDSAIFPSSMR